MGGFAIQERNLARLIGQIAMDAVEQRGFPRAVPAQDAVDPALFENHAGAGKHSLLPVSFAEVADQKPRHGILPFAYF